MLNKPMTETTNLDLLKRLSHALSSLNQHVDWLEKDSTFIQKDRSKYIGQLVAEVNSFIATR
jgi:archaellum biogenesis protein FlaJ (TadC family)